MLEYDIANAMTRLEFYWKYFNTSNVTNCIKIQMYSHAFVYNNEPIFWSNHYIKVSHTKYI